MKNDYIRIMLVDDHQLVRESWKLLLENNPRFQVIADCDNGNAALEQFQSHHPDIMLVDINMSPVNGFELTRRILETMPMASRALIKPGPITVTIAMASNSDGNASSTSITRMMTLSIQPPK